MDEKKSIARVVVITLTVVCGFVSLALFLILSGIGLNDRISAGIAIIVWIILSVALNHKAVVQIRDTE